ncbi:MAG: hypothetical protein IPG60_01325 [Bacteroidetes bacterium]|nr:hypothetical protein [Bacteroidota bacterium]MBP7398157.1 hypothetical protein [Chitinophagales bacterium]MBK7108134.1 hypothetical protein [Bacteroidota bacterium]MBK8486432.1 hypothetical protein [Bacteroidota bacterium]MBK8683212.1 hypothetical protein [Bacteroidota bacterium]
MRLLLGVYLTFMAIMFMRCSEVSEVDELAKQTERIQIVFTDDLLNYTDITDKKEIKRIANFITDEETPFYKCGYDGYMIFFTESGSVRMNFNIQEDCAHVVYDYAMTIKTFRISEDGIAYLTHLKE